MNNIAADINPIQYFHRRSQRTAVRRNFRWNQAKVRSTFHRSPFSDNGRPRGFLRDFQTRLGMCGRIPRLRIFFSQRLRVVSFVHLKNFGAFSRPTRLSSFDAYSIQQGRDLVSLVAGSSSVSQRQRHSLSVGKCMNRNPLALESVFHSLAASLACCKRAVDTGSLPRNHSGKFGDSQNALDKIGPSSVFLPYTQPTMRRRSRSPFRSAGNIGPSASGDQHPEDRVQYLTKVGSGFSTFPDYWWRGKKLRKDLPLGVCEAMKSASHYLSSYSGRQYRISTRSTMAECSYYWDRFLQ